MSDPNKLNNIHTQMNQLPWIAHIIIASFDLSLAALMWYILFQSISNNIIYFMIYFMIGSGVFSSMFTKNNIFHLKSAVAYCYIGIIFSIFLII